MNLDVHSNNQTSIIILLQIYFCMNILLPRFWLDIQLLLPTDSSATPLGALTLNGCHTHKDAERKGDFKMTSVLDENSTDF